MKFTNIEKYLQSCKSEFWKDVFEVELDYIVRYLKDAKNVLSIGCGPAVIEAGLAEYGFSITGLDISKEALEQVPDNIRTIAGSAESMNFSDCSFDAVIFVASLQFIEKYTQAVKEAARVLMPGGKLLIMLLNPKSEFFKEKIKNPNSYVSKIKYTNLKEIEKAVANYFSINTEYFLGIKGTEIFQSSDSNEAGLYIVKGTRKK